MTAPDAYGGGTRDELRRMGRGSTLLIVVPSATFCLLAAFGIAYLFDLFDEGGLKRSGVVVVSGRGDRPDVTVRSISGGDLPALEASIRAAISDPDVELRDVRIVDAGRRIACGERSVPGLAALRRFVWLGVSGIVVTDDGGPDFANLVYVCDPFRPRGR